ncbi:hypothetical protein [Ensifer canadensis]
MGRKDPKKSVEIPPETPGTLPDPERPIEEPGPDDVPDEAPDVTPVPGEEIPAKMSEGSTNRLNAEGRAS